MAHHVISVCIFCFICATHSPCASHAAVGHENVVPRRQYDDPNNPPLIENLQISPREKHRDDPYTTDNTFDDSANVFKIEEIHNLSKRNSLEESNDSVNSEIVTEYLRKIFLKYGNGDTMTMEGFERLIHHLDLHQMLSENPHIHDINEAAPALDLKLDNSTANDTCVDQELTTVLKKEILSSTINHTTFQKACPIILYSMIAPNCPEEEVIFPIHDVSENSRNSLVWLYSILAVVVISACGVLSLAIIPVMQKTFYKPLIQFLVALAVGTLAGDALLHLLPHAMSSGHSHGHEHGHDEHSHNTHDQNTWKGFVAMLGLTLFFIMERLISLAGKWRKRKQKHAHSHVTILNDRTEGISQKNDTQCMDRYNTFPYCYKDIMNNPNTTFYESDKTATTMLELDSNSDIQSCKKSRSPTIEKLETNQNITDSSGNLNINACTEVNKMLPSDQKHDHEDYTVIVREHKNDHHGHSHKHGHVHAAPQNFSSVAWMVIMGDGLHNFTDGMAIGAAFSEGVAGGFSTTLAVFCHELPHELGDFAMLLKAGMSIKQALFYNILSSVLCIFGNMFGLWLGNTEYASSWVFAAAAGMFIYIALVDMIPELSSAHEDEGNLMQCLLHLGGLLLGFGIMTLIALYEHDLKNLFNDPE
ncbi:zinc transporter foi [Anoplophora glabripennis]|uniref:zinc transporter foi n=1 Tax=Anoplophora glabripennis TaxID=217634 RepID=UPI000873BAC5|nr:zinc transporter foi [Anoplophora glabripennis]XP_018580004.1 zinc transporter foi [Anoplophora glabripennis]XP_018580005.1 zinc transporter foi [Anoplophora glabripennis]